MLNIEIVNRNDGIEGSTAGSGKNDMIEEGWKRGVGMNIMIVEIAEAEIGMTIMVVKLVETETEIEIETISIVAEIMDNPNKMARRTPRISQLKMEKKEVKKQQNKESSRKRFE
ncbi:MAG: hypothetical protein WCI23_07870 [Chlorobiaceae bacterium]